MKLVIIDYKLSNLFSVEQACVKLGYSPVISSEKEEILDADALILPGVGAFNEAMINLEKLGLIEVLDEVIKRGIPLMGVCLGMQLLFSESDEFGNTKGLDIIKGSIKKFPLEVKKIPHTGWSTIHEYNLSWQGTPLKSIKQDEFMYFVHSYYAFCEEKDVILTKTNYNGLEYCSSVLKNNIFATQFHPEKSGEKGLSIYKNWLDNIN